MAAKTNKGPPKVSQVSHRDAGRAPAKRAYGSVAIFYARAIAIEREAAARYRAFAHQMEGFGNAGTAKLFERLAQFESEHAEQLLEKSAGMKLPPVEQLRRSISEISTSEVATYEFLYRRVLPHHALLLALASERRAKAYFERVRKSSKDPGIRKLAAAFAREEAEHIAWLEKELEAQPQVVRRFDDLED